MRVASLAFRTDLMMRRLGGSEISDRGSHLVVRTPSNPFYWWGNFLLLREEPEMGEWPGWAAEFAREFPDASHLALGLDSVDGTVNDPAGAAALGLETLVDTVLTAEALRPPRVRPDVEIRPVRSDDDWSQVTRLRLSVDAGPLDPSLEKFVTAKTAEIRAIAESGRGVWFGAFIDSRMCCGAGLFSDGSGVARFQSVETHPDFRRRGLASALVHELGTWGLAGLSASRLVVVADPGHHAIAMYRALGFEDAEQQILLQRPPPEEPA